MQPKSDIPFYFIYGEAPREVEARFVHVETISARRQLHGGQVEPHRHSHLHQMTLWTSGGGDYLIETRRTPFKAPFLCVAPAGSVHGFQVDSDADATVISLSSGFVADVLTQTDRVALGGLDEPILADLGRDAAASAAVRGLFAAIEQEYRWAGLGRMEAIAAYLKLVLISALRLTGQDPGAPQSRPARTQLLGAFRTLLEAHFFEDWPVTRYAEALAVTPYLLNAALRDGLGASALGAIHERRLTEAKRLLLYSNQTISEIAFKAGFGDPAYFSRFFRDRMGRPPGAWREARLAEGEAASS